MQSQSTKQHQGIPTPVQISVKCPAYYKDSILADFFQHFCQQPQDKLIVICGSINQAKMVANSQFFIWRSILVHSDLDRRERIRNSKCFQLQQENRCLITNNIGSVVCRKYRAKLVVFLSPPRNKWVYSQVCDLVEDLLFIVVCYNTQEIIALQNLESELNRKLYMITPPDVQSEYSYSEGQEQAKQQQPQKQVSLLQKETKLRTQCIIQPQHHLQTKSQLYNRHRKPYTPNRNYQARQQAYKPQIINQTNIGKHHMQTDIKDGRNN